MALVATYEGLARLWQWILGQAAVVNPTLHLLGQAYTPHVTSTLSVLAANELVAGDGYVPVQLTSPLAVWSIAGIPDGQQETSLIQSWTFTAARTVYGYYLSDDTFGVSLWGELLDAPFVYGGGGGVFALQLQAYLANASGVS